MRLVGGSYQWEGRVEIFFAGSWGTITDSDWTSEDAQALCRMMGYFKPGKTVIIRTAGPVIREPLRHVNESSRSVSLGPSPTTQQCPVA